MAQQTSKYKLGYYEAGDVTDEITEAERFQTLDAQIFGLYELLGNGVVSGWSLISSNDAALSITVSEGSGHVNYVAVSSEDDTPLDLTASTRNYVYARNDVESTFAGTVEFFVTVSDVVNDTLLYLGYVDTTVTGIETVNMDGRQSISFEQEVLDLIATHRHIGGSDSPSKINLETDVQGLLQPGNIGDLDASIILSGVIDLARIPKIDHIDDLVNQGILTHAQLDTFVQLLDNVGSRLMGKISTVNLLKLILALKHAYPDIDDFLINELAFIPDISPRSIVDEPNTTATVDFRTSAQGGAHTITGTPADSTATFTKAWDEEDEFDDVELSGTVVFGDSVTMNTSENKVFVDDFENVGDWETTVTDLSSVSSSFTTDSTEKTEGDYSGKLSVSEDQVEVVLLLQKVFNQQSWADYRTLVFDMRSVSAEHGDIYFFISDAIAGSQQSYRLVLERDAATINRETLAAGWREMVVDISGLTRENVTTVGFYTSTDSGWETDAPFAVNIDNMYITTGNRFVPTGTADFVYGSEFAQIYTALRWEASEPDDTSLKFRTRVSNNESLLSSAVWSAYMTTSGTSISLPVPSTAYKYIEIEAFFESSDDLIAAPQLTALMLDGQVQADDFSFQYDNQDDWESGSLHNINTSREDGAITVNSVADLGTFIFGTDGSVKQLESDLSSRLELTGTAMPRSYLQLLNGDSPGFGQISAVEFGVDGTFVVADTDNDRVLEVDRAGSLKWGLMGAFVGEPVNPLVVEDTTTDTTTGTATTDGSKEVECTLTPVGCYYNPVNNLLSVMFDNYLSNIYTSGNLTLENLILKAGTRRIFFNEDDVETFLFGVDREHVSEDPGTSFFISSSILQIQLPEADGVTINNLVDVVEPTLVIASPNVNELESLASVTVVFTVTDCVYPTACGIRYSLDGAASVDKYDTTEVSLTGLADGVHAISSVLIDLDGNEYTTDAAATAVSFRVETGALTDAHVEITSPKDNQTVSTGDLQVYYQMWNLPGSGKLKYSIDGAAAVEWIGVSPMSISGLASGPREIEVFMTDSVDVPLTPPLSSATFEIVVGTRTPVGFSLLVGQDSINDSDGVGNINATVDVDVNPILFANIRAPFDVDVVVDDRSVVDATSFNVVVAKVATPSYLNQKAQDEAEWLDGAPVVEYDKDGEIVLSSSDAVIARTREEAKASLGSVEKGDSDELLIGDAIGRRAIVVTVDSVNRSTQVVWEYDSDRFVSDFSRVPMDTVGLEVDEQEISQNNFYVRRDSPVTWTNNSAQNIRILSGATTSTQFAADPDLTLFGQEFDSGILAPGESYTFRFINNGVFHYFAWPFIYTGSILATESPVSPQDKFIIVENDPTGSSYTSRIARIDAWGNVEWSFGETFFRSVKDAKPVSSTEVVVTT